VLAPEVDHERPRSAAFLWFGGLIIALMIGLRYKVGRDWGAYSDIFYYSRRVSASEMVNIFGDPAYALLTWSVSKAGGVIWQVNLVCGTIFAWGLVRFARAQTNPWLAMTIAIPYLVVVVAMGYSRQAVAIGILMAGLASVGRGASTLRFSRYVIAAALFHKTAAMVLPIMAFAQERNRAVNMLAGLALSVLFYDLFLSESINFLYSHYIKSEYSSSGAAIRVILSAIPSALYLLSRRRFAFKSVESKLWFYLSVTSLGLVVLLIAIPSSTAVDRMALYVIPVQMAIWSRIDVAYNLHGIGRILVVGLSAAILFTWLNFAANAEYWIPYQVVSLSG
jgi:hypothetical protein